MLHFKWVNLAVKEKKIHGIVCSCTLSKVTALFWCRSCCCSVAKSHLTPLTVACQASMSFTVYRSLLKLMSTVSLMLSNRLILCCPLLLLPSELALHIRWPKYWSFSFSINPSSGYSGLISFRMDWLDLLAGQGTLKSLLQHYNSKSSILQCSAFFMVQLSHPYMPTGKTIALIIQKTLSRHSNCSP